MIVIKAKTAYAAAPSVWSMIGVVMSPSMANQAVIAG